MIGSLTFNLARAHRKLHGQLDVALQAEGVSVEQWRVLQSLGDRGGQSMGDLVQNVLMNHPALTKLADRMVSSGLIHRVVDPGDLRRVLVHLTSKGKMMLERVGRIVDAHNSRVEIAYGYSKTAALNALLDDLCRTDTEDEERTGLERDAVR